MYIDTNSVGALCLKHPWKKNRGCSASTSHTGSGPGAGRRSASDWLEVLGEGGAERKEWRLEQPQEREWRGVSSEGH